MNVDQGRLNGHWRHHGLVELEKHDCFHCARQQVVLHVCHVQFYLAKESFHNITGDWNFAQINVLCGHTTPLPSIIQCGHPKISFFIVITFIILLFEN